MKIGFIGNPILIEKGIFVLTSLRKQVGFVLLMAFVIGWSSIAFASGKMLHQQMMSQMSIAHHQKINMTNMSNCHDMQQVSQQDHPTAHQLPQDDEHCDQVKSDPPQHLSCNDCTQLHCQSLTTYVDAQPLHLVNATAILDHPQPYFDYSAQHLMGFWQRILRPPKAVI